MTFESLETHRRRLAHGSSMQSLLRRAMCAEIVGLCATVYGHDCTPATMDINNNVVGWALENGLSKQGTLVTKGIDGLTATGSSRS